MSVRALQRLRFFSRCLRDGDATMASPITLREVTMKGKSGSSIACAFMLGVLALPALAAAPAAAPTVPRDEEAKYQYLKDAANAVVGVQVKALANARSAQTLGVDRMGSGVLIDKDGLVLTIGYLILEADHV